MSDERKATTDETQIQSNELVDSEGRTRFSEKVLIAIVHEAISGMDGLEEVKQKVTDIINIFGSGHKGIEVEFEDEGIRVLLNVVGQYGEELHKVSKRIRQHVKSELERQTGLNVIEVNVMIEDLQSEKQNSPKESSINDEDAEVD